MKVEETERGFGVISFKDKYGSECSLQESSIATEACIWLGVDIDFRGNECTRMHLTVEQVKELLPHLQKFVETEFLREFE